MIFAFMLGAASAPLSDADMLGEDRPLGEKFFVQMDCFALRAPLQYRR
jgi:hypothetical protein